MHIVHNCLRVCGLGSLLFAVGCGGSPTAPTMPAVAVPMDGAAAANGDGADDTAVSALRGSSTSGPALAGAAPAAARRCEPGFVKGEVTNEDFFILAVDFPAGCQWFAIDNEQDGNYWELTVPDYSQRNRQKYPRGFVGVGAQRLGVHFIRKIGYRDHRTLVLDVCAGSSCGPTSQRWVWTDTMP